MRNTTKPGEPVALLRVARLDVDRLAAEERPAAAAAAELVREVHDAERQHRDAPESKRAGLWRKIEKLGGPCREATAAAASAKTATLTARAELAELRGEASTLSRFIIQQETASARWAKTLGVEISDAMRAEFNSREGVDVKLRKMRKRRPELPGAIVAALKAEADAVAEITSAEDAVAALDLRNRAEIMGDPPNVVAVARGRLDDAVAASRAAAAVWCGLQRERFHVRKVVTATEATLARVVAEHQEAAASKRAILSGGLVDRGRALEVQRQRLFELTGSAEAEAEVVAC